LISPILGSDGALVDFFVATDHLQIKYRCAKVRNEHTLFIALRTSSDAGSAVLPFSENFEGSTIFLAFQATDFYIVRRQQDSATVFWRTWENWKWSAPREAPNDVEAAIDGPSCTFRLPLLACGTSGKVSAALYAKDFSDGKSWGWFFGSSDPAVTSGAGDRYIPHYFELDLRPNDALGPRIRGRLGVDQSKLRIYQLFVRLFGNLNETRKPNGKLIENGVGKFNNINDAALRSIREMGFSHVWLTGVLRQATGTDYSEAGLPADDPDLLKGVAGSPYAIKDYFDVCPDYAADPTKRLTEFKALVRRLHNHQLKALIDFVPNHVARSYNCRVKPEWNFGAADNRSVFFDPRNNYFYLQPDENGPPLQLPTCQDGVAISPTCKLEGMKCDGRFDGELEHGRVTGNNVVSWKPSLNDWYETVKLNYGFDFTDPLKQRCEYPNAAHPDAPVPDTWQKMDRVIAYWQTMGIDGFRCDMAHMQPPEFWKWLIQRARSRATEVVFIGEAYDNDPAKVPGSDPVISQLSGGRGNVMFDLLDAGFNGVYDDPTYRVLKGIYEGPLWANDLDTIERAPFIFDNSLRYAENHDEARLASLSQWSGIGMDVGRPVSAILHGLSRGPIMLYNGQEVGEPAAGAEGFGDDDSRTSIFDYWSMPELVRWVNGHKYDGGKLSAEQKALRQYYATLVRLTAQPAFRDGSFYPLNPENRENPHFGRLGEESVSGHWCYAFLRYDSATQQRFLVVVNLNPKDALKDVTILLSSGALRFLDLVTPETKLRFVDRLDLDRPATIDATTANLAASGLMVPQIAPLSARYFECLVSE
jgi:glycosidase